MPLVTNARVKAGLMKSGHRFGGIDEGTQREMVIMVIAVSSRNFVTKWAELIATKIDSASTCGQAYICSEE